jgi:hypothetical protein
LPFDEITKYQICEVKIEFVADHGKKKFLSYNYQPDFFKKLSISDESYLKAGFQDPVDYAMTDKLVKAIDMKKLP